MYVISVAALLDLDHVEPHQVWVENGLVREWTPSMSGRTIFVSHEWLGWEHADPNGEQLAALQRILKRLMHGEVQMVESSWMQQLVLKQNTKVSAKEWKAALPHMFVSIPQMFIYDTADQSMTLPAYYGQVADQSDPKAKTAEDLKNAVESIPAYIERTTLLLILVPVCMHQNRQEACSFATWRRRGWCNLEMQAALLKCGVLHVMVCIGPEVAPYFFFPGDAYKLVCGTGDFTCCQRGHFINGVDIECDKAKVRKILERMIDNKTKHLEQTGQQDRMRWIESLRQHALSGLPCDGWAHLEKKGKHNQEQQRQELAQQESHQLELKDPLELLRTRLKWQPRDDVTAKSTGRSLLYYAAAANDTEAVRLLLQRRDTAGLNDAVRNPDLAMGEYPATPLIIVMAWGSFDVARQLLDARAEPKTRMVDSGLDALLGAAVFGRGTNVEAWLNYFDGTWDLERVEPTMGTTTLGVAANQACDGAEETVRALLAARANPHCIAADGANVLINACFNDSPSISVIRQLIAAGADVNHQQTPRSPMWRMLLPFARWMDRCGTSSLMLHDMACWGGWTPLHAAAVGGKVAVVRELFAAQADPALRNLQGFTALDMARWKYTNKYSGVVPPLLQELLLSSEPAEEPGAAAVPSLHSIHTMPVIAGNSA